VLVFQEGPEENIRPETIVELGFSSAYRRAADRLLEACLSVERDTGDEARFVRGIRMLFTREDLIPVLFLCRHTLELYLKELLQMLDSLDDEAFRGRRHHDLERLWTQVRKRLPDHARDDSIAELNPLSRYLDELTETIATVAQVDPDGFVFRYPDPDPSVRMPKFDLQKFSASWTATCELLEELKRMLGAFIDGKEGAYEL
jgi:hypothetical protein